jgi:hypothetical protein
LIKDYKKRIVEEANSNGKRQWNIVIKNNDLYVATFMAKEGNDPTWNINTKVSQYAFW